MIENGVKLIFSHAGGLHIKGDSLYDFYAYNEEDKPLPINYAIIENKLKIFWNSNEAPIKITLGYSNAPEHNLYNNSDYLASPFCLNLK